MDAAKETAARKHFGGVPHRFMVFGNVRYQAAAVGSCRRGAIKDPERRHPNGLRRKSVDKVRESGG
jgi:hypothetical protein